jgi:hypothetical protein
MTTTAFKEPLRAGATPSSAELLDEMARDSGLGVSTDTADLLIPRLRVIQKTSSIVDPQRPEYLHGAQAGDFLLGLSVLRSGSEGIEVIPAGMKHYWIEIGPDRIFAGRHDILPADAKPARDGNKPVHRRGNGNLLEEVASLRWFAGTRITSCPAAARATRSRGAGRPCFMRSGTRTRAAFCQASPADIG